jgi:hypothetical protein
VEEGAVALTLCPACRAALGRGGAFAVDQSLLVLTGRAAPPR